MRTVLTLILLGLSMRGCINTALAQDLEVKQYRVVFGLVDKPMARVTIPAESVVSALDKFCKQHDEIKRDTEVNDADTDAAITAD